MITRRQFVASGVTALVAGRPWLRGATSAEIDIACISHAKVLRTIVNGASRFVDSAG